MNSIIGENEWHSSFRRFNGDYSMLIEVCIITICKILSLMCYLFMVATKGGKAKENSEK